MDLKVSSQCSFHQAFAVHHFDFKRLSTVRLRTQTGFFRAQLEVPLQDESVHIGADLVESVSDLRVLLLSYGLPIVECLFDFS